MSGKFDWLKNPEITKRWAKGVETVEELKQLQKKASLLYSMALAAFLKESSIPERLREYAAHSALNLGQAARDVRYMHRHPEADGIAGSVAKRVPSLLNNLAFAALPPHLHHSREELEGMPDQHSLREWFHRGYKPWEHDKKP